MVTDWIYLIYLVCGILMLLLGGLRTVTAGTNTPRAGFLGWLQGPSRSPAGESWHGIGDLLFGAAFTTQALIRDRDLGERIALPLLLLAIAAFWRARSLDRKQ